MNILDYLLKADRELALILVAGLSFFILFYLFYILASEKWPAVQKIKKNHAIVMLIIILLILILPAIAFNDRNVVYETGFMAGIINPAVFMVSFIGGIFETALMFGIAILVITYLATNRELSKKDYLKYVKILLFIFATLALGFALQLLNKQAYVEIMMTISGLAIATLIIYGIVKNV